MFASSGEGAIAMIWTHWTVKEMLLAAVILMLAFAASFLAIMLVRPHPVESSVLTEWRCSKTAGVVTVCTKKPG
jgi:hypothetical protein